MGRFDSPIVSSTGRFDESTLVEEERSPGFFKSFFSGTATNTGKGS